LFFAAAFLAFDEPAWASDECEGLRLARRFIQPAKGRLRGGRSAVGTAAAPLGVPWGLDAASAVAMGGAGAVQAAEQVRVVAGKRLARRGGGQGERETETGGHGAEAASALVSRPGRVVLVAGRCVRREGGMGGGVVEAVAVQPRRSQVPGRSQPRPGCHRRWTLSFPGPLLFLSGSGALHLLWAAPPST
jgi:hypothetical protein